MSNVIDTCKALRYAENNLTKLYQNQSFTYSNGTVVTPGSNESRRYAKFFLDLCTAQSDTYPVYDITKQAWIRISPQTPADRVELDDACARIESLAKPLLGHTEGTASWKRVALIGLGLGLSAYTAYSLYCSEYFSSCPKPIKLDQAPTCSCGEKPDESDYAAFSKYLRCTWPCVKEVIWREAFQMVKVIHPKRCLLPHLGPFQPFVESFCYRCPNT
jgi:hypothetical protein